MYARRSATPFELSKKIPRFGQSPLFVVTCAAMGGGKKVPLFVDDGGAVTTKSILYSSSSNLDRTRGKPASCRPFTSACSARFPFGCNVCLRSVCRIDKKNDFVKFMKGVIYSLKYEP